MSRLDIVIFGATGFTGVKAVEETLHISKKTDLSWGIAGRSQKKLQDILSDIQKRTGEDLSNVKTIIADVYDEQSLKNMCGQAKVIANCCGPYRHYGEQVIKACVEMGTHHVDVCGEPQFIETMQLKYNEAASTKGVYIISACGFDSIPNDMGVIFMQQNFKGTLNSVETYIRFNLPSEYLWESITQGSIHYGTWESLIYSLANSSELGPLRKQLYQTRLPAFKPKLQSSSAIHRHKESWCIPFPGADNSIVYRTQRYLYENKQKRPVQFRAYIKFPHFITMILTLLTSALLFLMTQFKITRCLLLKFPRVFSFGTVTHKGPTENVMNNTTFEFRLYGKGWEEGADIENTQPNKTMTVSVRGVNPGYGATVTALMWSAVTVLKEHDKLPKTGGVFTTGSAFGSTDLIKNLNENNLTFTVVSDEA